MIELKTNLARDRFPFCVGEYAGRKVRKVKKYLNGKKKCASVRACLAFRRNHNSEIKEN